MEQPRPLTLVDADNEAFWEATARRELRVQKCRNCGRLRWTPRPMCPHCNVFEVEWVALSGRGTIYSYTIVAHPTHPFWRDKVPYAVILVELDEGIRIVSNLEGWEAGDEIRVGARVELTWEQVEDLTLPQFRLTES
jgi:uncharacterized OB-fold protein